MGVSTHDGSNGQSGDKTAHQPSVDSTLHALSVPAHSIPARSIPAVGSHQFRFSSAGRMPCNRVVR